MKKLVKQGLISLIIIVSCALAVFWRLDQQPPVRNAPQVVEIGKAALQSWQPALKATGTLQAYQEMVVKSEIEGRVKQINFASGDLVPKDAVIVELENDMQKADLDAAKVQLNLSQLNFNRQDELYKVHTVTKEALDQAVANVQANQAAVEKAQAAFEQTLIKAPFAGRLGIIGIHTGDYLDQGALIVNLVNLNSLYVDFSVPEIYMQKLQVKQNIALHSGAYPGITFTGHVSALETIVDPDTRSIAVRATLLNDKSHYLLPGNFVEVKLLLDKPTQVITVPQTAVQYASTGNYVYTVNPQQQAQQAPVKIGAQINQNLIILAGLKADEAVVTVGANKIHPGSQLITAEQFAAQSSHAGPRYGHDHNLHHH